jgi:hypothetical protein
MVVPSHLTRSTVLRHLLVTPVTRPTLRDRVSDSSCSSVKIIRVATEDKTTATSEVPESYRYSIDYFRVFGFSSSKRRKERGEGIEMR